MKKLIAWVLCVCFCLGLCGCTPFSADIDELVVAPQLTGEMQQVLEALKKDITGKYQLKYPYEGDYRSAITVIDLDNDGGSEAVCFYSTTVDKTVTMHIAVVDNTADGWKVTATQKMLAGGVERVQFSDMDGDGILEIIVGWSIYGTVERKAGVYQFQNKALLTLLEEPYSTFLLCDLNGDLLNEIMLININTASASAKASCYGISKSGVHELGNCLLDGTVNFYYPPVVSRDSTGTTCIYVDSVKSTGMQTEVLFFKDGQLLNPLYDSENRVSPPTHRTSTVISRDFDGDGEIEIPLMKMFSAGGNLQGSERGYLTTWVSYNTGGFVTKALTLMNYSDGYYIMLNEAQAESITVIRNTEQRERSVYLYDYENDVPVERLFTIKTVTKSVYETDNLAKGNYSLLQQKGDLMYLVKTEEAAQNVGFSVEELKKAFFIISEEI